LARITVDDCIDKVPNRFELVLLAAYRARTIAKGSLPAVEPDNDKPPVIALREIVRGAIGVNDLREALIHSIQPGADVDQPETVAKQLPAPTDDGGQQPTESTEDELNKALQRALPPDSSPRHEEPTQEPQASRPAHVE
jgi:DNA-directed RNA polymerase subunit omega